MLNTKKKYYLKKVIPISKNTLMINRKDAQPYEQNKIRFYRPTNKNNFTK